ncbi:MAG: CpsD/CapB family tyrosine-protein kinase [Clostridia bacterium]|nr:CpsD/CapB family tyrosine-protein kinase [Clostridia bacterium]
MFKKRSSTAEIGKIVVDSTYKTGSEGYDRLRDNILFLNADGDKKVIQVESSVASEGKTTTICNLAVSLGLIGKKVVVVDLDFRRPKVHRQFGITKGEGIAEYILETKSIEDIAKPTKYENVAVVTSGAEIHNSSFVFISEKFKALISALKEKYDYVLLDCPPVLLVSDYIHIAKLSDGVLFIVAHAKTTRGQVNEAVKELKKNGANVLGAVFTMYDSKKSKYYRSSNYNTKASRYYKKENEEATGEADN